MKALLAGLVVVALLVGCDARVGPDNKEAFPGTAARGTPSPTPTSAGAAPVTKP